MNKRVYVVAGPTATGKSALAVALAHSLDGEVVSADSMQIYRKMDIGTAKPTLEEREGIPHHMIDIVEPDDPYSVALYQKQAKRCIDEILERGKAPILAGGTGLYINAITYDLNFTQNSSDSDLRERLNRLPEAELHEMLKRTDAQAAERIHPNNKKRVIRAIEIAQTGGSEEYDFNKINTDYYYSIFGLTCDRQVLYERIEKRVDGMVRGGLVDEVKMLYNTYGGDTISMQAIGYKELVAHFNGECGLDEAVTAIKQNTRRLAKRQLTWFQRDSRMEWLDIESTNAHELAQMIIEKGGM